MGIDMDELRKRVLEIHYKTRSSHIGSSFSCVDIIDVVYSQLIRGEERFILSKGHASSALYAVLEKYYYILKGEAESLGMHPDLAPEKGIYATTGSLGHGVSLGIGYCLGGFNTSVLISDGELNEGSTWEALFFAGHKQIKNLTVFLDMNDLQAMGRCGDILDFKKHLSQTLILAGWLVYEVDGHNKDALNSVIKLNYLRPKFIICKTVKGKGIEFMENKVEWHYKCPNDEEFKCATSLLNG